MNTLRLLLLASFILATCLAKAQVFTYTVAPQKGDCYGMRPMKCMQVKKGSEVLWSNFYSKIEGFDYEPGYTYVLQVKEKRIKKPAADGSSVRYILKKILFKYPAVVNDKEANSLKTSSHTSLDDTHLTNP